MDPLSITSAAITFWEVAMRLKSSIDKIGKIHQHTRELLEDVFSLSVLIKDFYEFNRSDLESNGLVELKSSLQGLKMMLLRVCRKCEQIVPDKSSGRLRRISAGYLVWKQSDEIDADLLRLKESLQGWVNRVHLMIAARSEFAIAKLANGANDTLVSIQNSRSLIRQFDDLFCQLVSPPDSRCLDIQMTSINELDGVYNQYVRLKLTTICDVLMEGPRVVSIPPGTYASLFPDVDFYNGLKVPIIKSSLLFRRLSDTWQSMFSASFPTISIVDLFSDLSQFGLEQHVVRSRDYFVRDLRHSLKSQGHGPLRKELLLWLQFALVEHLGLIYNSSSGVWHPAAWPTVLDALVVSRELQQLSSSNSEVRRFRLYLSRALRDCAVVLYLRKDATGALEHIQECLETSMPAYRSGCPITLATPLNEMGSNEDTLRVATIRQSDACHLFWAAVIHSATGDYSRACCLGRDAVLFLEDLMGAANSLHSAFNFLEARYSSLRRDIPTWINVSNTLDVPAAHVEEIDAEDELSESDTNGYYIEWGVAM